MSYSFFLQKTYFGNISWISERETSNSQFEKKIKNSQLPINSTVDSLSLPDGEAVFYRSMKITPWNRGTSEKREIYTPFLLDYLLIA